MRHRAAPVAPSVAALDAYAAAVACLRLVATLNDRPGGYVEDDAHGAASTALRAALAAFLLVVGPGGTRPYYADAATELYSRIFTESRSIAQALDGFLAGGFRLSRPGSPWDVIAPVMEIPRL